MPPEEKQKINVWIPTGSRAIREAHGPMASPGRTEEIKSEQPRLFFPPA
ncbi:hypothetical protein RG963_06130 [Methanosarcina sp. Z-7115]|uniref:Uncharacterized protein n=1 Tax=Methanosarcina baikalica TaxID=3073890 RepID=A0ABU2D059_9EURY|nr:hypothetical protein [Methanosarcina sp. Z-7115]MDR7665368.1 hypothetical protein [Methanosarcina sp. Z-7115]